MRCDDIVLRDRLAGFTAQLKPALRRWGRRVHTALTTLGSAAFLIAALLLVGVATGIAGVHQLFGPGWALIAASAFAMVLAALFARGAHHG